MDLEAVQLLNLSPIPELSEQELSTMLDQLSNLSDLNGDVTDRNVEDILKEAEELLDNSIKLDDQNIISKNTESLIELHQDTEDTSKISDELPEPDPKPTSPHTSVEPTTNNPNRTPKHPNSPADDPNRILSPRSANHIRSTIDSLKEFSDLMEKQISQSQNTSPKSKCSNESKKTNEKEFKSVSKEVTCKDDNLSDRSKTSSKSVKVKTDSAEKKPERLSMDKSIKLLNCFERLYQDRPVRLSANHKTGKITDRVPKPVGKKKFSKKSGNCALKEKIKKCSVGGKLFKDMKTKSQEDLSHTISQHLKLKSNISDEEKPKVKERDEHRDLIGFELRNKKCTSQTERVFDNDFENEFNLLCLNEDKQNGGYESQSSSHSRLLHSNTEESLIVKLLREMEEIKAQLKKPKPVIGQIPEVILKESQAVIDSLRSEMELVRQKVTSDCVRNEGIQRLEEQFSNLKHKYDQQLEKLEMENANLRDALNNQQRFFMPEVAVNNVVLPPTNTGLDAAPKFSKIQIENSPPTKLNQGVSRSVSSVSSPIPKKLSSLYSSSEDVRAPTVIREAFSQTENELHNVSIQCGDEDREYSDKSNSPKEETRPGLDKNPEFLERRKTDNKENVSLVKKSGKAKPFSDYNVQQLVKQKKMMTDHESRLLATLRGLQTEVTSKDKENRKLKTEIDLLKSQLKRVSRGKVEVPKRCHAGSQTIALGPIVQRPYDPKLYEASEELERDNEDLKLRVMQLEESLEMLKEKRINDLQALHQVHEEEMAKLVSKLETQSALTKHLHSLLINR